MLDWLADIYPWTKALHIMAVISWMAGLLYLPRLFVYHAEAGSCSQELSDTFKIMERKLLRFIMNPAMISAWVFGIMLLATPGIVDWESAWIWIKLTLDISGQVNFFFPFCQLPDMLKQHYTFVQCLLDIKFHVPLLSSAELPSAHCPQDC